jgi:hypothetical protein
MQLYKRQGEKENNAGAKTKKYGTKKGDRERDRERDKWE